MTQLQKYDKNKTLQYLFLYISKSEIKMGKIEKLQDEKQALELQLKELNFKFYTGQEKLNSYIIPREIFKIRRQITIKENEIERLKNKID